MDKKISDKIYERKNYYFTLLKLKAIFNEDTIDFSTNDSALRVIIAFQVLSGRSEESSKQVKKDAVLRTVSLDSLMNQAIQTHSETLTENKNKHFISENGFVFTKKIKTLEENYLDCCSKIQSKVSNLINEYIEENKVQLKIHGFNEMSLLYTNYEDWCDENIIDTDENKKEELKKHIYEIIESVRTELDKLELKRKKVSDYYKECGSKVDYNINRMKSTYGNRLQYLINTNNDVMSELININERLDNIEKTQVSYEQVNDIEDSLRDCSLSIEELHSRLLDTEENIINAIDVLQDEDEMER